MARLLLTESVIMAVTDKLRLGLPERIAQINTEAADEVTLSFPQDQDFYLGGAAQIPSGRTPAIIITDASEGGEFAEEGPHALVFSPSIVVFFLDEDGDRQRLAKKLLRLEEAIIETLWDDDPREQITVSDTSHPYIHPVRVRPGPVFNPEQEGEPYRQWRAVVFSVVKYE